MGQSILERNLSALAGVSPATAGLIARAPARRDLRLVETDDGVLSGELDGRALASKRRPLVEADRLAQSVSVEDSAGVVVMGFALGHHVAALATRIGRRGVLVVYEPDVELLRAVFEHIDHSQWIAQTNLLLLTDESDAGAISSALSGAEGLMALGVAFMDHPASKPRLGDRADRFAETFTHVMKAVRTTVVTTLVQVEATVRNLLMNLDHYAADPGVADLVGAGAGRPAVVVSAGPSLDRNVDLLADPDRRGNAIVICVQTVLKTLLSRGIKPAFVTALDHHEISKRFYEGLSERDVAGVTLVAEPKANPAILDAFPGVVRCPGEPVLDGLLGPELATDKGRLPAGATVAHLAYYLARLLGCDPVILIGQDLGFTDGQYYSAGASIHNVWAGELNPFRTLGMFEWERIVRERNLLREETDVLGRPIYTDEQMSTYLVQFERDFLADTQRGLRVIDATEGGVAKKHTTILSLADALTEHARGQWTPLPAPPVIEDRAGRLERVAQRVRQIRKDVRRVGEHCDKTHQLLQRMIDAKGNQQKINALIGKVHALRDRVERLTPAIDLVQHLNQTGVLNRIRADRSIELDAALSPIEKQRRQIERDMTNVRWLGDSADTLGVMLDDAINSLGGAPKITRDKPTEEQPAGDVSITTRRVVAMVPVDPRQGGLGTARPLAEPLLDGRNPLELMLARLSRCQRLDGIVLLTPDPAAVRDLAGADVTIIEIDGKTFETRRRAMRGGRLWSASAWRGGPASLTCYDEVCLPHVMAPIMDERGIDAALLVGDDWAFVDPALVDAVIDQYRQRPDTNRVAFSQAPPGLGGCVVDRTVMRELADRGAEAGSAASLGGVLGYLPIAPQADPIVKPCCVTVPPIVRDVCFRCIPDSGPRVRTLVRAIGSLECDEPSAEQIASVLSERELAGTASLPQLVTIELCTGRRTGGSRSQWWWNRGEAPERSPMDPAMAQRVLDKLARARTDAAITFAGAGDPLLHPHWKQIIASATQAAGVHVRTDLLCERDDLDALLEIGPDVVSVDLMADTPETYRTIMGTDALERVQHNILYLLEHRTSAADGSGLPRPWIVPRITRCDATYEEIESFYDRWLMLAGAAVIDPLPEAQPDERIKPLPVPASAIRRDLRLMMTILSDGTVPISGRDLTPKRHVGSITDTSLGELWRLLGGVRRDLWREHGLSHPDLWMGP